MPHPVGALALHARRGVRIGAERKGCSGVAQVFLHGFDIIPGPEAVDRERVSKGMKVKFAHLQAMQMAPHFAKSEISAPAGISLFLLRAHPPIPLVEHCPPSNGCAFF